MSVHSVDSSQLLSRVVSAYEGNKITNYFCFKGILLFKNNGYWVFLSVNISNYIIVFYEVIIDKKIEPIIEFALSDKLSTIRGITDINSNQLVATFIKIRENRCYCIGCSIIECRIVLSWIVSYKDGELVRVRSEKAILSE